MIFIVLPVHTCIYWLHINQIWEISWVSLNLIFMFHFVECFQYLGRLTFKNYLKHWMERKFKGVSEAKINTFDKNI